MSLRLHDLPTVLTPQGAGFCKNSSGQVCIDDGDSIDPIAGAGGVIKPTGVGDETAFLQTLITAAGAGATLRFDNTIQATVTTLTFLSDQQIYGLNVKRANKVQQTISSAVTVNNVGSGSTSITVSDGTAFSLGDTVTVHYGFHVAAENAISNIVGNVITFPLALSVGSTSMSNTDPLAPVTETSWSASGGQASVTKTYNLIYLPSGAKLFDCDIDGNKASWEAGATGSVKWDRHAEIKVYGTDVYGVHIERCNIGNFAGEGIIEAAGSASPGGGATASNSGYQVSSAYAPRQFVNCYRNNRIYNGGGNGVHLSGINAVEISDNYIDNCNQNYNVLHVSGGIGFSFVGRHLKIIGNYIRRCYMGIGRFEASSASEILVSGNTIKYCKVAPFWIFSSNAVTPRDIIISDNHISDCGCAIIGRSAGNVVDNILMDNNIIYGHLNIVKAKGAITGGIVNAAFIPPLEITTGTITASTTSSVVLPAGAYNAGNNPNNYYPLTATTSSHAFVTGDEVILTQIQSGAPVISSVCTIIAVGGTVTAPIYTLDALDTSFTPSVGNPVFMHSYKYRNCTMVTGYYDVNGTSQANIISGATYSVQVRDPALFSVGDFVGMSQLSGGATTTNGAMGQLGCVRIDSIDYTNRRLHFAEAETNSGTFAAAGSGLAEIALMRGPACQGNPVISCDTSAMNIVTETVAGYSGINLTGDCTGTKVSSKVSAYRGAGILTSSNSTSGEIIERCYVISSPVCSMSWSFGIQLNNAYQACKDNQVTVTSNVSSGGGGAAYYMPGAYTMMNNIARSLGTGYTFDYGAGSTSGVSTGNFCRNLAGATGQLNNGTTTPTFTLLTV